MNRHIRYWLAGAFLLGFLAIGVPYWFIPYDRVSLPNTLYGMGLLMVTIAAAIARGIGKTHAWSAIIVAGAAVPAAVLARIAVETNGASTSHDLWLLEVVIALIVGIISASIGALAGSVPTLFKQS